MVNLLVIEADAAFRVQIEQALSTETCHLTSVLTPRLALRAISHEPPDIVILDAAQEGVPAFYGHLRGAAATARLPILCLSASISPAEALNMGSDDFIRKPFTAPELVARVRALNRWAQRQYRSQLANRCFTLSFQPQRCQVRLGDRDITLTHTEYKLLYALAQRPGEYISIADLLRRVWKYPNDPAGSALVRNHICNLRSKIERDPQRPSLVLSQHGRGYGLSAEIQVSG